MKRTILSIIVAGLFAGIGGTAVAQNVSAGDQPAATPETKTVPANPAAKAPKTGMTTKQPGAKGADTSADAPGKADYTAAKDKAQADYKDAKAKCGGMEGDAMRSCMSEAKTARTQALAEAKTQWEAQGSGKEGQVDPSKSPSKGMKSDTRSEVQPEAVMQKTADRGGQPAANVTPTDKTSVTTGTNDSGDRSGQPAAGEGPPQTEAIKSGASEPSDRSGQPSKAEGSGTTDTIKAEKTSAHDAAHAGYKAAALKCDALQGSARRSCMTVAEKERADALAAADQQPDAPAATTAKPRDDRSEADSSEKYENVSTARKPVDGASAKKVNAN